MSHSLKNNIDYLLYGQSPHADELVYSVLSALHMLGGGSRDYRILEKFGDRLIYCDTDTFFLKHPGKLFAHIRPGHTVMHIGEYHLYDSCASKLSYSVLAQDFQNQAGQLDDNPGSRRVFTAQHAHGQAPCP